MSKKKKSALGCLHLGSMSLFFPSLSVGLTFPACGRHHMSVPRAPGDAFANGQARSVNTRTAFVAIEEAVREPEKEKASGL